MGHLKIPRHCACPFHMFWLLLPNLATRTRLIRWLATARIKAVFHYVPLDQSVFGAKSTKKRNPSLKAAKLSKRLIRLPFYLAMTTKNLEAIVSRTKTFQIKS